MDRSFKHPSFYDAQTMMRMVQAISEEMDPAKLARKTLDAIEHVSGATRAVFLLPAAGSYSAAVDTVPGSLPLAFVESVATSERASVLRDIPALSARDRYFDTCMAKAVLCVPVLYQGTLRAVVYLESDQSPEAFTPECVALIEIFARQAGISLENVACSARLRDEVARYSTDVREAHLRVMSLEKESNEMQVAAGFAHELRNALSGARWPLAALYPIEARKVGTTLYDSAGRAATAAHALAARAAAGAPGPELQADLAGLAQRLRDDHEMAQEMFENVSVGLERGLSITREILDFAHAGHLILGNEQVNIDPVVSQILRELGTVFERRGIATESQVPYAVLLPMKEEHAYAIVRNLIANASDALASKTDGERKILIKAEQTRQGIIVSVQDTGIGMSEATQAKLFRPFFTTKGSDGTGLGLGLSRKLARMYGGDLLFNSREQVGTTFTLILPPRPQDLEKGEP